MQPQQQQLPMDHLKTQNKYRAHRIATNKSSRHSHTKTTKSGKSTKPKPVDDVPSTAFPHTVFDCRMLAKQLNNRIVPGNSKKSAEDELDYVLQLCTFAVHQPGSRDRSKERMPISSDTLPSGGYFPPGKRVKQLPKPSYSLHYAESHGGASRRSEALSPILTGPVWDVTKTRTRTTPQANPKFDETRILPPHAVAFPARYGGVADGPAPVTLRSASPTAAAPTWVQRKPENAPLLLQHRSVHQAPSPEALIAALPTIEMMDGAPSAYVRHFDLKKDNSLFDTCGTPTLNASYDGAHATATRIEERLPSTKAPAFRQVLQNGAVPEYPMGRILNFSKQFPCRGADGAVSPSLMRDIPFNTRPLDVPGTQKPLEEATLINRFPAALTSVAYTPDTTREPCSSVLNINSIATAVQPVQREHTTQKQGGHTSTKSRPDSPSATIRLRDGARCPGGPTNESEHVKTMTFSCCPERRSLPAASTHDLKTGTPLTTTSRLPHIVTSLYGSRSFENLPLPRSINGSPPYEAAKPCADSPSLRPFNLPEPSLPRKRPCERSESPAGQLSWASSAACTVSAVPAHQNYDNSLVFSRPCKAIICPSSQSNSYAEVASLSKDTRTRSLNAMQLNYRFNRPSASLLETVQPSSSLLETVQPSSSYPERETGHQFHSNKYLGSTQKSVVQPEIKVTSVSTGSPARLSTPHTETVLVGKRTHHVDVVSTGNVVDAIPNKECNTKKKHSKNVSSALKPEGLAKSQRSTTAKKSTSRKGLVERREREKALSQPPPQATSESAVHTTQSEPLHPVGSKRRSRSEIMLPSITVSQSKKCVSTGKSSATKRSSKLKAQVTQTDGSILEQEPPLNKIPLPTQSTRHKNTKHKSGVSRIVEKEGKAARNDVLSPRSRSKCPPAQPQIAEVSADKPRRAPHEKKKGPETTPSISTGKPALYFPIGEPPAGAVIRGANDFFSGTESRATSTSVKEHDNVYQDTPVRQHTERLFQEKDDPSSPSAAAYTPSAVDQSQFHPSEQQWVIIPADVYETLRHSLLRQYASQAQRTEDSTVEPGTWHPMVSDVYADPIDSSQEELGETIRALPSGNGGASLLSVVGGHLDDQQHATSETLSAITEEASGCYTTPRDPHLEQSLIYQWNHRDEDGDDALLTDLLLTGSRRNSTARSQFAGTTGRTPRDSPRLLHERYFPPQIITPRAKFHVEGISENDSGFLTPPPEPADYSKKVRGKIVAQVSDDSGQPNDRDGTFSGKENLTREVKFSGADRNCHSLEDTICKSEGELGGVEEKERGYDIHASPDNVASIINDEENSRNSLEQDISSAIKSTESEAETATPSNDDVRQPESHDIEGSYPNAPTVSCVLEDRRNTTPRENLSDNTPSSIQVQDMLSNKLDLEKTTKNPLLNGVILTGTAVSVKTRKDDVLEDASSSEITPTRCETEDEAASETDVSVNPSGNIETMRDMRSESITDGDLPSEKAPITGDSSQATSPTDLSGAAPLPNGILPQAALLNRQKWLIGSVAEPHVVQLDVDDTLIPTTEFCEKDWLDKEPSELPQGYQERLHLLDVQLTRLFDILHRMVIQEDSDDKEDKYDHASFGEGIYVQQGSETARSSNSSEDHESDGSPNAKHTRTLKNQRNSDLSYCNSEQPCEQGTLSSINNPRRGIVPSTPRGVTRQTCGAGTTNSVATENSLTSRTNLDDPRGQSCTPRPSLSDKDVISSDSFLETKGSFGAFISSGSDSCELHESEAGSPIFRRNTLNSNHENSEAAGTELAQRNPTCTYTLDFLNANGEARHNLSTSAPVSGATPSNSMCNSALCSPNSPAGSSTPNEEVTFISDTGRDFKDNGASDPKRQLAADPNSVANLSTTDDGCDNLVVGGAANIDQAPKNRRHYLLSVVIITNATMSHIRSIFPRFLPNLTRFFVTRQIALDDLVCSARDLWSDEFPFDHFYDFWKCWTLEDVLAQLRMDGIHALTVLSIGDDEPERRAAAYVRQEMPNLVRGLKIIKLLNRPTIQHLSLQLEYLIANFQKYISSDSTFDVYFEATKALSTKIPESKDVKTQDKSGDSEENDGRLPSFSLSALQASLQTSLQSQVQSSSNKSSDTEKEITQGTVGTTQATSANYSTNDFSADESKWSSVDNFIAASNARTELETTVDSAARRQRRLVEQQHSETANSLLSDFLREVPQSRPPDVPNPFEAALIQFELKFDQFSNLFLHFGRPESQVAKPLESEGDIVIMNATADDQETRVVSALDSSSDIERFLLEHASEICVTHRKDLCRLLKDVDLLMHTPEASEVVKKLNLSDFSQPSDRASNAEETANSASDLTLLHPPPWQWFRPSQEASGDLFFCLLHDVLRFLLLYPSMLVEFARREQQQLTLTVLRALQKVLREPRLNLDASPAAQRVFNPFATPQHEVNNASLPSCVSTE